MDTEQRFIELIEHHKRIIYKVCYVYAPGRGQIDDYFQEVVLALWRGFPDFRGESKTATWVYRIALYTCISFVRRRMRVRKACAFRSTWRATTICRPASSSTSCMR